MGGDAPRVGRRARSPANSSRAACTKRPGVNLGYRWPACGVACAPDAPTWPNWPRRRRMAGQRGPNPPAPRQTAGAVAPVSSGSRSFLVGAVGANWKNARKSLSPLGESAPTGTGGRFIFSGGSGGNSFRQSPWASGPCLLCTPRCTFCPPGFVSGDPEPGRLHQAAGAPSVDFSGPCRCIPPGGTRPSKGCFHFLFTLILGH